MIITQRACKDCKWKFKKRCRYKYRRRDSALRRCINAARHEYIKHLTGNIIEVGPGVNSLVNGFHKGNEDFKYFGIRDRVSALKLEDNFADAVIAGQCIEHWHERGDTLEQGITEIHRVLKPGGLLYIDVPIYSHGLEVFVEGDIEKFMLEFSEDMWEIELIEQRRSPCAPLDPIETKYTTEDKKSYPLIILARKK